ncbi:MAG: tetratricopeptide repeat protein, partial [Desulfobacterales bacterium]|nr:tetratricopeptide repeat protein [Desulfobacterales bacterium]
VAAGGGVGKTALVRKWLERMAAEHYRGARRVFAWAFYAREARPRASSSDRFIRKALEWFGDPNPDAGSAWSKGARLAQLVQKKKSLLILDGLTPLQSPLDVDRGRLNDPALETLFTGLARENQGLCIFTTREELAGVEKYGERVRGIALEPMSVEAGRALLKAAGVRGADRDLDEAIRRFGANALALDLLSRYLREAEDRDISHAPGTPDPDGEEEAGAPPRRIMEAFVRRLGDGPENNVLHLLGLFDRPAEKAVVDAVLTGGVIPGLTDHLHDLPGEEWLDLLAGLRGRGPLAPEGRHGPEVLDCHPLTREYFGRKLKEDHPEAWKEAHGRLFEYYKSLPDKELPDTLEEMAPLFAATAHGCRAGRRQEALYDVYWSRIKRKGAQYSAKKLGALGSDLAVLSCFFEGSWSRPAPDLPAGDKAIVLNWAGFRLRELGRYREAVQAARAGLEARVEEANWNEAARDAGGLCELHLTLGDVKQAVDYGRRSVELADQGGESGARMTFRAALADALHQAGELAEAEKLFRKAEALQKERQPEQPYLYSLRGFQLCALLLGRRECGEVIQRAGHTLEFAAKSGLAKSAIALDKLSLGRAHLLQGLEEGADDFTLAEEWMNQAVADLRESGQREYLPRGLLARAGLRRARREFTGAWEDLEEAREIAGQGGMGVHLADCHLEAARLHLDQGRKENAGKSLEKAKDIIEEMGYHLRDQEIVALENGLPGRAGKVIKVNGGD